MWIWEISISRVVETQNEDNRTTILFVRLMCILFMYMNMNARIVVWHKHFMPVALVGPRIRTGRMGMGEVS